MKSARLSIRTIFQPPTRGSNSLRESSVGFLLILWLLVQGILFYQIGIFINGEAVKYLNEADYFLQYHHFSQPKYLFYSTYIFLQLICKITGIGITGAYIVQLLVNLAAMYCFLKLAWRLTGEYKNAMLATTLLILCFPWQIWTTHLYTESIFTDLIIIFSYFLFLNKRNFGRFVATGISFQLLFFARPTGMLFIPALIIFGIYSQTRQRKTLSALLGALFLFAGFILVLNYAMKGQGEFDFLKPFIEEDIICGVPTITSSAHLILPQDGNSIQGLLYYIIHNPLHFAGLSVRKMISFWGFVRPYYSPLHNLFLAVFFYPIYFFALIGLRRYWHRHRSFFIYSSSLIFLFSLSIILTCDNWLNRFIMPIIPVIILLSATGILNIRKHTKIPSGKMS